MLRILEQKNLDAYQEIIRQTAIPDSAQLHLTEALEEDDSVKGWILYAYQPEQILIYALDDGKDWNYCDGLLRSVLFKAQLRGIEKAVLEIPDSAVMEKISRLGFVKNEQKIIESISEIMENCKKCKENPANT